VITWAYNIADKNPQIRAAAFFIIYLLAVNVSGAHFNPAVSVAVYLTEKENRNMRYLIWAIVVQVLGCGFGVIIAYFLLKDYLAGKSGLFVDYSIDSFSLYPIPPSTASLYNYGIYYYMDKGEHELEPSIYFSRVCFQEILQTMVFVFVFLAVRYDPRFSKSSRMLKGLALMHVLWGCYALSLGAGACLNPAFGFAQSLYWLSLGEANAHIYNMSCMWVYIVMPFVGAAVAAVLFRMHRQVDME